MNDASLAGFSAALSTDGTLREGLIHAVGAREGKAALSAMGAFATQRGFALSEAELAELGTRLAATEREGVLDDAQLEGVTGAKIAQSDVPDNMLALLSALKAVSP